MNDTPLPANASAAEIAASVEGNLFALFRQMATLLGGEIIETPKLAMHSAPFANPMFRGAWASRFDDVNSDETIAQTLDWFRQRGAPFVFWWTGPRTTPVGLANDLLTHGFVPFEVNAPGMAARISELDVSALERAPNELRVETVVEDPDLAEFEHELVAAFGMPDWAARSWGEATRAVGIEHAPWKLYVARMGRHPVGTAMLIEGAGVAGVLAIGVREEWRGKGIGSVATLKPLLDAGAHGYEHAVLFATPLGQPVYARLGFRRCDVPISRYLWQNPQK